MTESHPLIIGEVLFDHFPDGRTVPGGAPFNVAWNLQGLGMSPLFVSAVGDDENGREVKRRMDSWGMDRSGLQSSRRFPTGTVQVEIQDGEPTFRILENQAYDDIQYPSTSVAGREDSMLYVGSLAFRAERSRSTIRRLIENNHRGRFVDINLRRPWFDRSAVNELLTGARWVKLNQDELEWIAEAECRTRDGISSAVRTLRERFGGELYFITCGSAGACAIDAGDEMVFADAPSPEPLVDAVGAGDAFSAAIIHGLHEDLSLDQLVRRGVQFASRACSLCGATTDNRNHYRSLVMNP